MQVRFSIEQWGSLPDRLEGFRGDDTVSVLALPNGIEPKYLPDGCVNAQFEEHADIIVLTHPNAEVLISRHLPPSLAATLPVVGMGASLSQLSPLPRCDLTVCSPTRRALSEILTTLKPVVQRNRRMPPCVKSSEDARVLLMARLYVRERGMAPRRDPGVKSTLSLRLRPSRLRLQLQGMWPNFWRRQSQFRLFGLRCPVWLVAISSG